MSKAERIRELRERFNTARRRGKHQDALLALRDLEQMEPEEPRWPHQQGELFRRMGRAEGAADAFERAIRNYAKQGFLARAMALGKALLQIDPDRAHVLEELDPKPARQVHRTVRPKAFPKGSTHPPPLRKSVVPLALAPDAREGELRFEDLPTEDIVELDVSELELFEEPPPLHVGAAPSEPERSGATVEHLALMPTFPLFAEIPQEVLAVLVEEADLVELPDGATVVRAGEKADALYCLVDGAVRVVLPEARDQALRVLSEGEVFGEQCLLRESTHREEVVVEGALTALRIPKAGIDRAVEVHLPLGELLFELLTRRLMATLMRTSPLFSAFEPESRRELAHRFELRSAPPGETVLERGKTPDGLYVLLEGAIRVLDEVGQESVVGAGAIFGQRALLSREPSLVTVSAARQCIFLRLPASKFTTFAALYPPALAHLASLSDEPVIPGGVDPSGLMRLG
jgi:cAMP-dependent protein kinase regulator